MMIEGKLDPGAQRNGLYCSPDTTRGANRGEAVKSDFPNNGRQ